MWLDTARGIDVAPERRGCGYVFQEYALFGHLRAWQNVAYPLTRAAARAPAASARRSCSSASGSARWPTRGRGRCRAASASAWRWRGRSRAARGRCCSTSRCRRSTPARAPPRAASWAACCARRACPALLVTHDFTEAALLGDEVAVVDGGRIVQRGEAARLAAEPASAFVADFTGAVVLTGFAHPAAGERHAGRARRRRRRDRARPRRRARGGQRLPVGDRARARARRTTRARRATTCSVEVVSVTAVGNRVRVGLAAPQPLTAELSDAAVRELELRPGLARRGVVEGGGDAAAAAHRSPDGVEDQLVKQRLRGQRGRDGRERAPAGAASARAAARHTNGAKNSQIRSVSAFVKPITAAIASTAKIATASGVPRGELAQRQPRDRQPEHEQEPDRASRAPSTSTAASRRRPSR